MVPIPTPDSRSELRRSVTTAALAVLLGLVLRGGYVLVLGTDAAAVSSKFWGYAGNLLERGVLGHGDAATTWPDPLYSCFLAGGRAVGGGSLAVALLLQASVGALGAVFVYLLANRLTDCRRTGLVAALLFAVYPYYVRQAGAVIDFTLFTTLLAASAWLFLTAASPVRSGLSGVAIGLTILTRAAAVPLGIALTVLLLLRRQWLSAFVFLLMAVLACVPWYLRNHSVDGSFLPTKGGWNFAKGNCRYTSDVVPEYSVDLLGPYLTNELAENQPDGIRAGRNERDIFFRQHGWAFIREAPGRAITQRLANLWHLYSPRLVPHFPSGSDTKLVLRGDRVEVVEPGRRSLLAEIVHAASYTLLIIAAVAGMWLRRRSIRQDAPLYFIALVLPATYAMAWPATRLRASIDFVFMLYAAVAIQRLLRWRAQRRSGSG